VTLPRRSQVAPPSPAIDFDDLPSPGRRPSTIGVNFNLTPSTASASARKVGNIIHSPPPDPDEADLSADVLDEDLASQALPRSSNTKKRGRKSTATNGDDDEGDGVEMGRNTDARLSMASRKSGVVDPGADTDEEEPSEVGGPSFRFDGNLDDGVGGNGMDADEEDAEADAGLEEAAMAAEVGSAEEDEDQAPNERERHPRPTGKRGKKRYDLPPAARVRAPKKRTRVSRLENGACPLSFDAKVRDLTTAQRMTTGYTATLCPVVLADNISRH